MKLFLFTFLTLIACSVFAKEDCAKWWRIEEVAEEQCIELIPQANKSCVPVKNCFIKAFDGMPKECWVHQDAKTPYAILCADSCEIYKYADAKICFE